MTCKAVQYLYPSFLLWPMPLCLPPQPLYRGCLYHNSPLELATKRGKHSHENAFCWLQLRNQLSNSTWSANWLQNHFLQVDLLLPPGHMADVENLLCHRSDNKLPIGLCSDSHFSSPWRPTNELPGLQPTKLSSMETIQQLWAWSVPTMTWHTRKKWYSSWTGVGKNTWSWMSTEQSSLTTSDIYVTARKQHSSKGSGEYQVPGVHIMDHLSWSKNTGSLVKTEQHLHFLHWLKRSQPLFSPPSTGVPSGTWYPVEGGEDPAPLPWLEDSFSSQLLNISMCNAYCDEDSENGRELIKTSLPSIKDTDLWRCLSKANHITKDNSHSLYGRFTLLASGSLRIITIRFCNSFIP